MNSYQSVLMILLGVVISGASANPILKPQPYQDNYSVMDTSEILGTDQRTIISQENENSKKSNKSYQIGSQKVSAVDKMVMVYVPMGGFPMGSNDGSPDEKPVHLVYLDAFWIDQTEVTNAQYALCVDDGVCNPPIDPVPLYAEEFADHPVVYLDWDSADTYCQWVGRRLPTEAEWEKAARGTDNRTYPWGNEGDCSRANFWDCPAFESTSPVGFYGELGISPYGTHDMAGNVWEWVYDWYDPDYYQDSPIRNPRGPTSGIYHVWRGGSWNCNQTSARSAGRGNYNPDYWIDLIGFRCAMDADPY